MPCFGRRRNLHLLAKGAYNQHSKNVLSQPAYNFRPILAAWSAT
ncbi:benzoate transporter [Acetobacter orientalis]|uniref:Benzoate transporter n=1 Tax=Acetobacter orientalis TaxID=146474 RepID=A0A2Z5ZLN4_9PROT|nr:benzoate transporter [Acetobacter orientalis]